MIPVELHDTLFNAADFNTFYSPSEQGHTDCLLNTLK